MVWFVALVIATTFGTYLLQDPQTQNPEAGQSSVERHGLQSSSEIVSLFDRLALVEETPQGRNLPYRWNAPLRLAFAGVGKSEQIARAQGIWREAARHAGLEIIFVERPEAANLVLHFAESGTVKRVAEDYGAKPVADAGRYRAYHMNRNDDRGSILEARVIMDAALDGDSLARSLRHEIMHALGFPNHPAAEVASVLAPRGETLFADFTMLDKILIRTLYDPRIRPGDTAEAVRGIAPVIVDEFLAVLKSGAVKGGNDPKAAARQRP